MGCATIGNKKHLIEISYDAYEPNDIILNQEHDYDFDEYLIESDDESLLSSFNHDDQSDVNDITDTVTF